MAQIPDPQKWSTSLLRFALSVLVTVIALNMALHLLLAIAPVLIVVGIAVLCGYIGWLIVRFRRSHW